MVPACPRHIRVQSPPSRCARQPGRCREHPLGDGFRFLENYDCIPIQSEPRVASSADETNSSAAIDRDVLAAWLADDRDSLDELLKKFQQTAIEAEREIEGASRRGNLTTPGSNSA